MVKQFQTTLSPKEFDNLDVKNLSYTVNVDIGHYGELVYNVTFHVPEANPSLLHALHENELRKRHMQEEASEDTIQEVGSSEENEQFPYVIPFTATWGYSEPTDEGHTSRWETLIWSSQQIWELTCKTASRDCDGPHETYSEHTSVGGDVADYDFHGRLVDYRWESPLRRLHDSQRDIYAERMNY